MMVSMVSGPSGESSSENRMVVFARSDHTYVGVRYVVQIGEWVSEAYGVHDVPVVVVVTQPYGSGEPIVSHEMDVLTLALEMKIRH